MNKKLIGISGKKQHGKDTLAEAFTCMIQSKGLTATTLPFAAALKEEVALACGCTTDFIETHKKDFRLILQGWGTDFRRKHHGDNYWLKAWVEKYHALDAFDFVIVPDVRFFNEYNLLVNEYLAPVVRVSRVFEYATVDEHKSETELDDLHDSSWSCVIQNDSGLFQLYYKAYKFMSDSGLI